MKGRTIVLDHLQDREAAALIVDGRLEDFLIDDPGAPRPGTIYRAICDRPVKGQGGMFLRLPGGSGFLRGARGLAPGQAVLVQVTGYAEDGKATPLTQKVLFKSRYAIVTPDAPGLNVSRRITDEDERVRLREIAHEYMPEGPGLILRSSAEGIAGPELAEDITAMADIAADVMGNAAGTVAETLMNDDGPHLLAWRDWTDRAEVVTRAGGFAREGVLDALDDLRSPRVALAEGHMYVEPTRALIAVDVNTGGDTSPAAALKANLAAARALPRALRLRGLGGQIAVDFAPLSKAHRKQLEHALKAAFRTDPVETALVGWTPLGHFELQRKRERAPVVLP